MEAEKIKDELLKGAFNSILQKIYVDKTKQQTKRYVQLVDSFIKKYGNRDVHIFSSPGRSEIGGNHTDHQRGRVLAAAIDLDAVAVVSKRDDMCIEIYSEGFDLKPVNIRSLDKVNSEEETSESLIRGISARFQQLGYQIGGFCAYMDSEVLGGSGLSSSACFEVLVGTILSHLFNNGAVDAVEIAKIGQYSENEYFGKPCGLMDQMACSIGGFVEIDFKDKENPQHEKIAFDFSSKEHVLCIVDTKGSHANLTEEYAAMPYEMKEVAAYFKKEVLREVDEHEFYRSIKDLRESVSDRAILRAMHFFEENARVLDQVEALKTSEFEWFKRLVEESGHSSYEYLQNVLNPNGNGEQNLAIALGLSKRILDGQGVSRVHGGGFAGTIQAIVPSEMLQEYKDGLEAVFGSGSCYVLNIRQFGGIQVI